jgi:hypothetical protein
MLWCPSITAFRGDGQPNHIPLADKLGGLVIKQIPAANLESKWISRAVFQEVTSAYTMKEVYGSDMTGFSSGGFVWAAEMTCDLLTPAANLVGSLYRGTVQYGQLPPDPTTGLSLRDLIEISSTTQIGDPRFHLRAGVVNHDVVFESQGQ